jgi:hypothetical protein
MKRLFILIAACALIGSTALYAQDKTVTKKQMIFQTIKKQLEDKHFKVMIQWAYPMQGSPISLTGNYSLEIKGDTIQSYLPYYGRAYSIPYGGGKGLNFNATISDYNIVYKKDRFRVYIKTRNEEDIYVYQIEVFKNGSTGINVDCQKRESIKFQGDMVVDLQTPGVNP